MIKIILLVIYNHKNNARIINKTPLTIIGSLTDKLAIKWYKPFDTEVVETVPMGYLPMNKVDWKQFQKDLNNLPSVDPSQVIKAFEEKWSPKVVAQYIIDTVKES